MTNQLFYIKLLLVCLIWNTSFSQDYVNYTEKDGLASNFVYRMTQDDNGFIWFLTDKGLSKFDGQTFKNFTVKEGLPTNDIFYLRFTPNGRAWYFTRSDRLGFIENDSVYSFRSSNNEMMNPNSGIHQSGNNITFAGAHHDFQFKDSIWQAIPKNRNKYKFHNKDILLLTDIKVGHQLQDITGKILYKFKPRKGYYRNERINDSLFVRWDNSVYEIVNLNNLSVKYGRLDSLKIKPTVGVTANFHFENEQLQCTLDNWVICFNEKFGLQTIHSIPQQLKSTFNFKDKDGFIWIATNKNGVFKLPIDYEDMKHYFHNKKIIGIEAIDENMYVAIEDEGVYKCEESSLKPWLNDKSKLYSISKINDAVVCVFMDYLIIEKESSFEKVHGSTPNFFAKTLVSWKNSYFAQGFLGIRKFNNKFEAAKEFNEHTNYQGLFKQNDSLFSFSFKEMLYYNEEIDAFINYHHQKLEQKLLVSETFNNLTYIGTEGDGLYRFSNGAISKLITTDNSIINHLNVENENSIWAVSQGVLLHYYRDEFNLFKLKKYHHINGFPTNNLTEVLFYKDQLYLGSTNGLTVIDRNKIVFNSTFIPYVKNVSVNGKKQPKDSLVITYHSDLTLKVNFGAINFLDAETATYEYRLAPIQDSWTTTESGEVNLYDLQPNDYTLLLKVTANSEEIMQELPIHITPKWWQTQWFIAASILISLFFVILILFFVFRSFQREHTKKLIQEKQLAQIQLKALRSQMNPHFVFNSLAAIQYYMTNNEVKTSEVYLVKFSKLIRQFFECSKRNEIDLLEEVILLRNYLDIEKLRFREKFTYTIDVDQNLIRNQAKIPSMLLQPIVENAVNHGIFNKEQPGTIRVVFNKIDQELIEVLIIDDGVGFVNTHKNDHQKIKSSNVLRDRIYFLNRSLRWAIQYNVQEAFPARADKGNISTFSIKKLT